MFKSIMFWDSSFLSHIPEIGYGFLILCIIDIIQRLIIPKIDSSSRWFVLHIIANLIVVIFSFPDLIALTLNPLQYSTEVTTIPKNITFALHIYHCLMFRNLQLIDWIHHIVMCAIIVLIRDNSGAEITNFIIFFTSGFPGGIDYIMLILVKLGKLESLNEKRINSQLNTWIRGPGILIGAVLLYIHYHLGNLRVDIWRLIYALIALYWNAQYFTNRVIVNYGMKLSISESPIRKEE